MSGLGEKRPREDDGSSEASRPRKRPGGAARISKTESEAVHQRQQQRAKEANAAAQTRGVEEAVRQHYNAVPQRGREWRKTDSRIKGLRSFNNWIKSTLIHKFSPSESGTDSNALRLLDIGCGKGGDLGKWQQAPQPVELYVGIDPAEVSIDQARERYQQMRSGGGRGGRGGRRGHRGGRPKMTFDAEFLAEDAFSFSLGDIPIIREVGFGASSRWGPGGGFDVVSMMFCMHYAFENEAKAKGMLANVSGSLRKGGRFLGVIPNSDVLRSGVTKFHRRKADVVIKLREEGTASVEQTTNGITKTKPVVETIESKGEPSSPQGPRAAASSSLSDITDSVRIPSPANDGTRISTTSPKLVERPLSSASATSAIPNGKDDHEPSSKPIITADDPTSNPEFAEWGNSLYRVRFPGPTPKDGIFRPPYGWKYSYFMEEAVEEVPEYVVPWEAFRA